ncbi:MAG TPA: hypothetical protein VFB70_00590, partial [Pyrinomonadaceae bacterium]|nr:hypothetical protein [Pyrinomonadaceae bacterium]
MNAASTELDVDQLMSAIRDAASKKHPNLDAGANHQPISDVLLQHFQLRKQREPLTLSPEFMFHGNETYHVNDL